MELLIDNKNGNVWDISEIVSEITWRTSRLGRPGSLEFTLTKGAPFQTREFAVNNGDVVRFRWNGLGIFYGYIFSVEDSRDETKVTAYDQIRYLLASDTYVFKGVTATDVVRRIAQDFGLRLGRLDDTKYRITTMVEDGQMLLDIIDKALVLTAWNTGKLYVLYDDFGSLTLRDTATLVHDLIIGDESLAYDYQLRRSIDEDTYNVIKLYRDNKKTGKREVYVAQDSANIAKWGRLQLYQSVDEDKNEAQIKELLDQLIKLKNRETLSLRLETLGDPRVRAGHYVRVILEEHGINQPYLVDECTHRFRDGEHTMTLDLKVV